jgi:hypothetical protein
MNDDCERRYLDADDALSFERQEQKQLLVLPGLALFGALSAGVGILGEGGSLGEGLLVAGAIGIGGALYLGGLVVLFGVIRTRVSRDELWVEAGMLGPRIPISEIVAVERVPFPEHRLFGSLLGHMLPSTATECVRIRYEQGGRERTYVLGTRRAAALLEAIEQAMRGAMWSRVRAEEPARDEHDEAETAEAEAEAAEDKPGGQRAAARS